MNNGILSTIGQTPLVPLKKLYKASPFRIYGKMEMFNPGASIKDRPAFKMICKALEEGKLRLNDTIIESSSGNMAIGLAQVCRSPPITCLLQPVPAVPSWDVQTMCVNII
ncbi:pyridoxal-phosphate dependent enzyme [Fodinibius sp.]|uniref:pyridoxal-phosphate dependent enzyme n=1 Tax=Fodinibius sp. TaxID=1872440 RepID=UPI0035651C1E